MTELTRIVAAVVDTTKATFYKADGTTVELLQGDARLRPILEYVTPILSVPGAYADIDLSTVNSWKEFEEQNTGGFRFFKVAKDKLKSFFGSTKVDTGVVGILPSNKAAALDEIMKHATPVTAQDFRDSSVAPQRPVADGKSQTPSDRTNAGAEEHFDKHPDTIVAVSPTGLVIPGIERIKSQFAAAVKNSSTKGMEVFLTRIGKVIQQRQHTVPDLLRFMERGDMPVADDGSIVAFKKLYRRTDKEHGEYFVDPHTRKVRQKIGSYVHMDANKVDPNRRNECSNGLHVGRRGYMGGFSGDTICIVKINPEDVVAVPDYDANKMRVCGYHVLRELTPMQFAAVNNNRPVSDAEGGAQALAEVIAGHHVAVLENVKICGTYGEDLQITSVKAPENSGVTKPKKGITRRKKRKITKKLKKDQIKKIRALKPVKALDAEVNTSDKAVDIKAVVKLQSDPTASLAPDAPAPLLGPKEEAQALYTKALTGSRDAAQQLLTLKKEKKKGWAAWGLDPSTGDTLKGIINGQ